MKRKPIDYLFVFLRGIAMGAADVVPGVSGGTIAFITGIYEELLNSIKSINPKALGVLKNSGIKGFWNYINGTFLVALFAGIGLAVASLARLLSFLMEHYPEMLWGFFFGLILASAFVVGRKIGKWNIGTIIALILGTAAGFLVTTVTPTSTSEALWFVFISGAIAICAMILPGISGSFILLILGKYHFVINAIKEFDFKVIITFGLGCVVGLLGFSQVLSWLFKKYRDLTIAVLTGFMVGSLNKVWPWKETTEFLEKKPGEWVAVVQENILPNAYEVTQYEIEHGITSKSPFTLWVILLMLVGFGLVIGLELLSGKLNPEEKQ